MVDVDELIMHKRKAKFLDLDPMLKEWALQFLLRKLKKSLLSWRNPCLMPSWRR